MPLSVVSLQAFGVIYLVSHYRLLVPSIWFHTTGCWCLLSGVSLQAVGAFICCLIIGLWCHLSGVSLQAVGAFYLVSHYRLLVPSIWCLTTGCWCLYLLSHYRTLVSSIWCLTTGCWCLLSSVSLQAVGAFYLVSHYRLLVPSSGVYVYHLFITLLKSAAHTKYCH